MACVIPIHRSEVPAGNKSPDNSKVNGQGDTLTSNSWCDMHRAISGEAKILCESSKERKPPHLPGGDGTTRLLWASVLGKVS